MAPVSRKLALAAVVVLMCLETNKINKRKKKKKKKKVWSRSWLGKRGQFGMPALKTEVEAEDQSNFKKFLRVDVDQFNHLLQLVAPHIVKSNTQLRKAISPRERLSITLRYLATGESFTSLSIQYRIGRSTVGAIVKHTCKMLHFVLKEDYLKTPATEAEWRDVANDFQNRWQFPHCLGAVDGKEPEAACWITLAAVCLHNYLSTEAAETYIPPALVDEEDEHHKIIPGYWRNDTTLQSVSADKDQNPCRHAEEQRDKLKGYFVSPMGSVSWQEDRL